MFMRNFKRIGAVAVAFLVAAALVAPALAANQITVGQFVQELARAKNLNATDARIAADNLAAIGIVMPSDLSYGSRLTEGDVASIARAAGLNVRASAPTATFDDDKVDRFFTSFSRELSEGGRADYDPFAGSDEGDGEEGKGKGKGKGGRTPVEPV